MSTRIDITVLTRSLRQFAKQVVFNNRMAQLQKESDRRTESEAKIKREKKVEAEVPWPGAVPEGGVSPELAAFRDPASVATAVWELEEDSTEWTLTVRNPQNSHEASVTIAKPRIPTPENAWFVNGNGSDQTGDFLDEADTNPRAYQVSGPSPETLPDPLSTVVVLREEHFEVTPYFSHRTFLALPIDANSCILVLHLRQALRGYHLQVETTVNQSTGSLDTTTLSTIDYVLWGGSSSSTVVATNDELFAGAYDTKCFYVGPKAVKEVTPPAALLAAIAKFSIPPAELPTTLVSQGTYTDSGTQSWEFTTGISIGAVGTGGAPVTYYLREFDTTDPQSFNDYVDALPLLQCYGIGALDGTQHQRVNGVLMFSPAVYTFLSDIDATLLSDYDGYFAGDYETNLLYAEISGGYLADAPKPTEFIGPNILSGGSANVAPFPPVDRRITFDRATVTPVSAEVALSTPSSFARGTRSVQLNGLRYQQPMAFAWNWDKSSYCRTQLLALGFTSADLKP